MSLASVLQTYGQIGVKVLQQAVAPLDATRKTFNSIRFESTETNLKFFARSFFELLEKGIKPSKKKPSRDMIESMTEYAKARGFENPEKAAWAISVKQLDKGDTTFRKGGRVVYSDDMQTFTKELAKELASDYGKELALQFKGHFK